jgi:hypothetical protein
MRDFKYIDLISGRLQMKAFFDSLKAIRSDSLKTVAEAFGTNVERLKNLALTPAGVATDARRDAALLFYSEFLVTGKIAKPFTAESKNIPQEVFDRFHKMLTDFDSKLNDSE